MLTFKTEKGAFFRARLFYLIYYAGGAFLTPFLGLYYRSQGLTGWQIGILSSIPAIMMMTSTPLWGALSDQTQRHRQFLGAALLGAVSFALLLSQMTSFPWLLFVALCYSFFAAPIMPLNDNTVIQMLGGQRNDYGKFRLWGAVGWGLTSTFIGWLTNLTGIDWTFRGYAIFLLVSLIIAMSLPFVRHSGSANPFWVDARRLLTDRRWLSFLAIALVSGVAYSSVNSYLFLFLSSLGADKTTMGYSLTLSTSSEIPIYLLAGWMFQRWRPRSLFLFGIWMYVLRLTVFALAPAPWAVLLAQPLHGLTYGLIWIAGVAYAHEIAPPGLGATAQGTFAAVMLGFGSALGSFFAGTLIDALGYHGMYTLVAFFLFVGLLIFLLAGYKKQTGRD